MGPNLSRWAVCVSRKQRSQACGREAGIGARSLDPGEQRGSKLLRLIYSGLIPIIPSVSFVD